MKPLNLKVILFFIVVFCNYFSARAQPGLTFQYDAAGNQIVREWICINCTTQQLNSIPEETIAAFNSDFAKKKDDLSVVRSISAFPNPVTETLKVQWQSTDGIFVKAIRIYSASGETVFQEEYQSDQNNTTIPFLNNVRGLYVLRVNYSDGKWQSFKIMKQ